MPRTAPLALPALLLLAACSGGDKDTAPGGVTQSEAAALNDAAAMLDANALAPDTVAQPKERP
ncbi:hypothetical protein [Sphingomonas sp. Leaf4]|uniref:hypothetical protein n=1 Tax=Sphingomonas sp. Leaf4 TaxID=2876553 RepID=UPI001E3FC413|nr:hypothetical protein [Sphingomonas sp. Leaf4]